MENASDRSHLVTVPFPFRVKALSEEHYMKHWQASAFDYGLSFSIRPMRKSWRQIDPKLLRGCTHTLVVKPIDKDGPVSSGMALEFLDALMSDLSEKNQSGCLPAHLEDVGTGQAIVDADKVILEMYGNKVVFNKKGDESIAGDFRGGCAPGRLRA